MYDYIKQLRWAKIKVGLVVTLSLAIVFMAVMFAGNIEKVFAPKVIIYAYADDIKGLREGSPVWFSGVEIGAVKSIDLTTHRKVQISMSIESDALQYLRMDSRANILTLGLLGDKYVEITPGSKLAEGLNAGDMISGTTPTEIQDFVQTSQESLAKISDFMTILEDILVEIEKGEGTVSKFIRDPSVYDNLRDTIGELSILIEKIESGKGSVGRLLNEDVLYNDVSAAVKDVRLFAETLKESEGTLNKLISDPSLYDRFQRASESLDTFAQRLASSKGTVGKLIDDVSLYENINAVSEKLDRLLGQIDEGQGLMGSLVKDDELAQDLKTTLKELNALIKDVKDNPRRYFKFSLF